MAVSSSGFSSDTQIKYKAKPVWYMQWLMTSLGYVRFQAEAPKGLLPPLCPSKNRKHKILWTLLNPNCSRSPDTRHTACEAWESAEHPKTRGLGTEWWETGVPNHKHSPEAWNLAFGLHQSTCFMSMLVRMLVALLKERTFFLLKATSILTSILSKNTILRSKNYDVTHLGQCLPACDQDGRTNARGRWCR